MADRPQNCNYHDEEIPGINDWTGGHRGDWDYWTKNGEWILWNGQTSSHRGAHGQRISIIPQLHNWGSSPWPVRIFFRCVKRY